MNQKIALGQGARPDPKGVNSLAVFRSFSIKLTEIKSKNCFGARGKGQDLTPKGTGGYNPTAGEDVTFALNDLKAKVSELPTGEAQAVLAAAQVALAPMKGVIGLAGSTLLNLFFKDEIQTVKTEIGIGGVAAVSKDSKEDIREDNEINHAIYGVGDGRVEGVIFGSDVLSGTTGGYGGKGKNQAVDGIQIRNSYLDEPKQKVNSAGPGDVVRTPDNFQDDFIKLRGGDLKNKYTGEIWSKSFTDHSGGPEWKVGIGRNTPTSTSKITIDVATGKIIKVDK